MGSACSNLPESAQDWHISEELKAALHHIKLFSYFLLSVWVTLKLIFQSAQNWDFFFSSEKQSGFVAISALESALALSGNRTLRWEYSEKNYQKQRQENTAMFNSQRGHFSAPFLGSAGTKLSCFLTAAGLTWVLAVDWVLCSRKDLHSSKPASMIRLRSPYLSFQVKLEINCMVCLFGSSLCLC